MISTIRYKKSVNNDQFTVNNFKGNLLNLSNTIKELTIEYSDIDEIIFPPLLQKLYIISSKIKLDNLPNNLITLNIVDYNDQISICHDNLEELDFTEINDITILSCPKLKKIKLEHDTYCDKILNNLPNNVEIIELHGDFLNLNNLPSKLKIFRLYEMSYGNKATVKFPISIVEIELNEEINILNLSECINLKIFEYNFCNQQTFKQLPDSVEQLILDNSYLSKLINIKFPKNIKIFGFNYTIYYLSLDHTYNYSLNNLLNNVKHLNIGPNYYQPLFLPDNVSDLTLSPKYPFFESIFNSNLQNLIINNYGYYDDNHLISMFPNKLIKFDTDTDFNFELLPDTIEEIIVRDIKHFILNTHILKPNLKKITFINIFEGHINYNFNNIECIDCIDFNVIPYKKQKYIK